MRQEASPRRKPPPGGWPTTKPPRKEVRTFNKRPYTQGSVKGLIFLLRFIILLSFC